MEGEGGGRAKWRSSGQVVVLLLPLLPLSFILPYTVRNNTLPIMTTLLIQLGGHLVVRRTNQKLLFNLLLFCYF